ncbi:MAG: VUT family protein, partial [Bacteroidetes bacterium]
MYKKENLLFVFLGGFFITNALVAEFIGAKIFSLEATLGFEPVNWTILGQENLSFNLTAGVILWPVVFIMTDIINEYYGKKGVRLLSWLAAALISYAFLMVYLAIITEPASFWINDINTDIKPNIDVAFRRVLGQGLGIILGSLTAFLIGQLVDVTVFHWLRRFTGASKIWLRATGSTLVSQLIDSFVVLFIAFYIWPRQGNQWPIVQIFAVGIVNYAY